MTDKKVCVWECHMTCDGYYDYWKPGRCGETVGLMGYPYSFKFCPYCGKPIKVKKGK